MIGKIVYGVPGVLLAVVLAGPAEAQHSTNGRTAIGHANALSRVFRDATQAVIPTVVEIRSVSKTSEYGIRGFEGLFGPGLRQPRTVPRQGSGSGVIIRKDGLILTNNHVVEDADEVTVELHDGRRFKAVDVRTDPSSDLAIVRIDDPGDLSVARLGNSDAMQIGDWVLAIGSPFELEASVSAGIISAKGRSIGRQRSTFLQTDAAINPGNSGGPLVNLAGEVIGINTAIKSSSGGYQGIGFAIPINLAKWVTDQLVEEGKVRRAFLGVAVETVDPDIARALKVDPRTKGVLVRELIPDSPASRAGVVTGDIITRFGGRDVSRGADLQRAVERLPMGSRQTLTVIRDGRPLEFKVTLEALEDEQVAGAETESRPSEPRIEVEKLGIAAAALDADLVERLGLPAETEGIVVLQVAPGSIAQRAGLRRGAIITKVGSTSVANLGEFRGALENEDLERGVLLTITVPDRGERLLILRD